MMLKKLMKNPAFLVGFIFLFGMFGASLVYYVGWGDEVPKLDLMKNGGEFMSPPYSPVEYPPLGTDNFNRNIFLLIIVGAKYTIGAALIITLCRVLPSVLIGLVLHFYLKPFRRIIDHIVDAANYFPPTLLSFLLLNWMLLEGPLYNPEGFPYDFTDKTVFYLVILIVISLPSLTLLFTNEYDRIMGQEFIDSAKVLGATKRHYIRNHIRPFILPQILLVSIREFMIIMLLIAHLGVLNIYIGGASFEVDLFDNPFLISLSHEWSGLLGGWWQFLWTTYPWISFIPVIFFTLTILSAKLMLIGATQVVETMVESSTDDLSADESETRCLKDNEMFQLVKEAK
ncbi:peptide ABC transporter permease [Rossellomorea vietnamensis]|uniref:Peptide ABC transporter permease n=2 Tax=Rossellomorea vietnamensis TaxID=218284 RepID=A0A0P6W494_9BACI|nr:peptide ABC transporter permease [Rossellomorea vietnamensis]